MKILKDKNLWRDLYNHWLLRQYGKMEPVVGKHERLTNLVNTVWASINSRIWRNVEFSMVHNDTKDNL